ncbi:MAG: hypothetical protein ACI4Q0_05655 [Oligosphaeraceae bacterium]
MPASSAMTMPASSVPWDWTPILHESYWWWTPKTTAGTPGYTLFRREFSLARPLLLHLALSADCRYRLYLDGTYVGCGPVRGDLQHYAYDSYSLPVAPGRHILAVEVVVWRGGWRTSASPWSELHAGGGLLLCGRGVNPETGKEELLLDLDSQWQCKQDRGRAPREWHQAWGEETLIPAPPMDEVDFQRHDSFWNTPQANPRGWHPPLPLARACVEKTLRTDPFSPWLLVPRAIRTMRQTPWPIQRLVSQEGSVQVRLCQGVLLVQCRAGKARIILDLGRNQTSLVHVTGQGGAGSLRLAYAEDLYDERGKKADRRSPQGTIGERGYADLLRLPAGKAWQYHSFWYRAGRFWELTLALQEELTLELRAEFQTYDFLPWKPFSCPQDPMLEKIYQVGVHTLQCCAHEHFEDCPYYEQLQYAGDTRIQALISYLATGEDSLGRQALRHFHWSLTPQGLTQSRYPSAFPQHIPGFSLFWILMVQDHFQIFHEAQVVQEHWEGMHAVLEYFHQRRTPQGLVGCAGHWNVTDWADGWSGGKSDRESDLPETILNLFYVLACRAMGQWEREGLTPPGGSRKDWHRRGEEVLQAVQRLCWDPQRSLFQDVPGKPWYSLHAQAVAILAEALPKEVDPKPWLVEAVQDQTLIQPTLYFSFYLLEALRKTGNRQLFLPLLAPWRRLVEMGYTTFPEVPSPSSRSECHGWSCAPVYALLQGDLLEKN